MATSTQYFFRHRSGFSKKRIDYPEWRENGPRHAAWKIEAHDGDGGPTTFYIASLGLEQAINDLLEPDADGDRFYNALVVYTPAFDDWRRKYSKSGWRLDGEVIIAPR